MRWERLSWLRLGAIAHDAVGLGVLWVGTVYLRAQVVSTHLHPVDLWEHLWLVALVVPVWLAVLALRGSYSGLRRKRPEQIAYETVPSVLIALGTLLAGLFLLKADFAARTVVLGYAVLSVPTVVLARQLHLSLLRRLRQADFDPHRVAIVGSAREAQPFVQALQRHEEWGFAVVGEVEDALALGVLMESQPVDEVYVSRFDPALLDEVARVCDDVGVQLSLGANFLGLSTARAELADFDGCSVLTFSSAPSRGFDLVLKRSMDLLGAVVGLALLAPVLGLIAGGVKLQDGGPVLFVQRRAGRFGRLFPMLKFRTMVPDAEAQLPTLQQHNQMSGPVFKLEHDPRVTPLGRFLRRTSLDELPQLVNVLLGQMSLVGPRPPLPSEVAAYERWQLRRLSMRPGITCIWQVSGRNTIDFDRWMALDLEYIDNWSLWLDVGLLLRTVPAVLRGTGAR